jgi:hypothetical protein
MARPQQVIAAAARSGIRSLDDVVALARRRPVVFGVTAPGSQNFVTSAVMMAILGIDARFVAGYAGSREVLLGAIRGDFDLLSLSLESAGDQIGSGDVIPLATVIPDGEAAPRLPDVPSLGGPRGIVQQRPDLTPDRERALSLAETIHQYLGAGRLIAARRTADDGAASMKDCAVPPVERGRAARAG